jgi:hypothetical protein
MFEKSGRLAACLLAVLAVSPASATRPPIVGGWEGEIVDHKSWPTFVRIDVQPGTLGSTLSVLGQKIDLGQARPKGIHGKIGDGAEQQILTATIQGAQLRGRLVGNSTNAAFTLTRVPELRRPVGRVTGWNADLSDIETRVLRFDRSFSAAEKSAVRKRIAALRPRIARMTDDAIHVQLAELLALAHNAHTRLYLLRNRTEMARLPMRLWWFGDQLRIVRAAPGMEVLVGCRVTSIGGRTVDAAYARVSGMYSGSPGWKRYMSDYTLTAPSVLHGAGIEKGATSATLGLSDCPAAGQRTVSALPFERSEKAVESWWDLAPDSPSPLKGWRHALSARTPRYLRRVSDAYWFDEARPDGIFYLQLNRAANAGSETVAQFAERAAAEIQSRNPRAIVVDIRFNTGGDGNITKALIEAVARVAGQRPVYAIVSRSTFSAGIVAAAQLKQLAHARLVGEPVGDGLDFWSEGGNIILSYSGLAAHFANGAHSLSPAACPTRDYCDDMSVDSLQPDIPAALSWADYTAGIDPSERAILLDLAGHR